MLNSKTLTFPDLITLFCVVIFAWLYSEYGDLRQRLSNEAEMLNNTGSANETFMIFNRVPKAGTETLMELLEILSYGNKFTASKDDEDLKIQRHVLISL